MARLEQAGSGCRQSRQDDRPMTGAKIKAGEKPAIEAYLSTLIERAFRNNADIRFCHRPGPAWNRRAIYTCCLEFSANFIGALNCVQSLWIRGGSLCLSNNLSMD